MKAREGISGEMRIIWNSIEVRFEAQLTPGPLWTSDKESASQAGMKCIGPPEWIWQTAKCHPLSTLRENRPQSGLTITAEALQQYNKLKSQEDSNAAVKIQLETAKKALKKEQKFQQRLEKPPESDIEHGEFDYFKIEPVESRYVSPPNPTLPSLLCLVCSTPVYFYECQEPFPLCLDCEFSEKTT